MKFILMVCVYITILTPTINAQGDVMMRSIRFHQNEMTLQQLLHTIEEQSIIHFSFDPTSISVDKKIKLLLMIFYYITF